MYCLDMFFPTGEDIPDFGTIRLTDVGKKIDEGVVKKDIFGHDIDMRLRKYVLMSKDIEKLDLISNASDGSKAFTADTGDTYILCDGVWNKQSLPEPYIAKWHQIESTEQSEEE